MGHLKGIVGQESFTLERPENGTRYCEENFKGWDITSKWKASFVSSSARLFGTEREAGGGGVLTPTHPYRRPDIQSKRLFSSFLSFVGLFVGECRIKIQNERLRRILMICESFIQWSKPYKPEF